MSLLPPRSSLKLWFAVFVSLVAFCSSECADVCSLVPLTCNYINYPVYTDNLNLVVADQNASNLISRANRLSALLPNCASKIRLFACAYYYPSCNTSGLPIKPCKDMCTTTKSECLLAQSQFTPEENAMLNCESDFYEQTNTNCYRLTDNTPAPCSGIQGECHDYNPSLAPSTGHLCSAFVSKKIYLETANATEEQKSLDTSLGSILELVEKIFPLTPKLCYQSLVSSMCRAYFPTCHEQVNPFNSSEIIAVASEPCRATCEKTNSLCKAFFDMVNMTSFNCSGSFGEMTWQEETYVTTKNTKRMNVTTTCESGVFAPDVLTSFEYPIVESCPFPMARNPTPDNNERTCWIPCPDPTYSTHEWDALIIVGKFFGSISFVCMSFMTLTSLLDGKRRKFPANLHICEYVSAMLLPVTWFLGGADPKKEAWCDDAITYATLKSNARCGAQGYIFVFALLSIMFWWLVLSLNMFLAVVLGKRKQLRAYQRYYYAIGVGIPFIFTTAVAAQGHIAYSPPAAWCFIAGGGFNIDNFKGRQALGSDYSLFYIPIGIVILLASAMFAAVLFKVVKVRQSTKQLAGTSSVSVRVQARLMVFVAVLLVLFVLIFEWRFVLQEANGTNIRRVDLRWAVCKIRIQLGIPGSNPDDCPGDDFPLRFNYFHTAFETWLAASMGIFVFLIFGSEKSIYIRWHLMLLLAKNGKWNELIALIKETTPGDGSQRDSVRISRTLRTSSASPSASARGESNSAGSAEQIESVTFEVQDSKNTNSANSAI